MIFSKDGVELSPGWYPVDTILLTLDRQYLVTVNGSDPEFATYFGDEWVDDRGEFFAVIKPTHICVLPRMTREK